MQFLDRIFDHYRAGARSRWFWLGLPVLLYSWTLNGPLVSDDLHMILKCEQYLRGERAAPDLFRFARSDEGWNELRDRGTVPWWMPEQGRQDFFRPAAEWSFVAAVRIFGRNVLGHRLFSLAVFASALMAVHWMFMQVRPDVIRAGVATLFFGASQTAMAPTVWMCNRSDMMVVLGSALCAGAYWAAWSRPRLWQPVLAAAGCALALLAKEVAIALPVVVVGHELLVRCRRSERLSRPAGARISVVLLLMAVAYVGYYRYSRPWAFDVGGTYAGGAVGGTSWWLSLLLYASVWMIGFPIDALLSATHEQSILVGAVALALAIPALVLLRRSAKGDSGALFFALWAVLFVLPCLKSIAPSPRYICAATVGWVYLLVGLIVPAREDQVVVPRPLRHWLLAANVAVSTGCIIVSVLYLNQAETSARARIVEMTEACSPPLAGGDVLFATQSDSIVDHLCSGDRLEYVTGLRDVSLIYLLPPGIDSVTEVEDDCTLLVRSAGQSLLGARVHQLALSPEWKPEVGCKFRTKTFTAEVANVRDGDFVEALRIRFSEPLSSQRLRFFPASLNTAAKSGRPTSYVQAKGS